MLTQVQQWGNSLGLRIPKSFAQETHVKKGSKVDLSTANGQLIITPVQPRRYSLRVLLDKIKPHHLHHEIEIGSRLGQEIW